MATDKLLINRQSKSANPRATATPSASLFKADMRFPMWSLHALTCHVQQAAAQATQSLRRSLHAYPTEFWEPVNQPRSFDTLAKRNRTTLVMVRATHRYLKRAQARSRLWRRMAGGSKPRCGERWRTCTLTNKQMVQNVPPERR